MPNPVNKYAEVSWCAEDIKGLRPNWSKKRAEEFLANNENHLRDRMTELGWEVIETFLSMDETHLT